MPRGQPWALPEDPSFHMSRAPTAFTLLKKRDKGVAYEGIPREKGAYRAWSQLYPTTSAGWASKAFRASEAAQKARLQAEDDLAWANHYEEVARASAMQAQNALLQSQQEAKAYAMKSPSLQPFLRFCRELADHVKAHPKRTHDNPMIEMRRFCAGLDDWLDKAGRSKEALGSNAGLRLYDLPPQWLPEQPIWSPSVPSFHAPTGLDFHTPPYHSWSNLPTNSANQGQVPAAVQDPYAQGSQQQLARLGSEEELHGERPTIALGGCTDLLLALQSIHHTDPGRPQARAASFL
eukprot:TRINITY_DN105592_c0_g1_i1.p1 TRINITY_DN105592_c0_g1~~TRINITY_DN105592_c0_g1_i1.p1  ORF type:complete len:316 (-),score=51.78 TRINITY_DN105592_c0_g1_i1:21-896(-)